MSANGSKNTTLVWMTIYADLITNLMFFFLAAWILSRVDKDVQAKVSEAFRTRVTGKKYYEETKKDVPKISPTESLKNEYSQVEITEKRIKITLPNEVLFASGSSILGENTRQYLSSISDILKRTTNPIIVEGFTDNVPRREGSNWELSLSRAISVVDFFVDHEGIPRTRFMVAGYGEFKPLMPNTTDDNRRKNRRIEITVLRYEV